MKSMIRLTIIVTLAVLGLTGCLRNGQVLPTHDETLIYALPYDLVYLRTLEALQNVEGWELEETDKEKGMIRVRNTAFSQLSDADQRLVTFEVRRTARDQTSLQIAPGSQSVIGGDVLLETISKDLAREMEG